MRSIVVVDEGYRLLNDAAESDVTRLEQELAIARRRGWTLAAGWFLLGAVILGLPSVLAMASSCRCW